MQNHVCTLDTVGRLDESDRLTNHKPRTITRVWARASVRFSRIASTEWGMARIWFVKPSESAIGGKCKKKKKNPHQSLHSACGLVVWSVLNKSGPFRFAQLSVLLTMYSETASRAPSSPPLTPTAVCSSSASTPSSCSPGSSSWSCSISSKDVEHRHTKFKKLKVESRSGRKLNESENYKCYVAIFSPWLQTWFVIRPPTPASAQGPKYGAKWGALGQKGYIQTRPAMADSKKKTLERCLWLHRRLSAQWMGLEEAEQVYFPYWMDVYPFRPPEHGFLDFHVWTRLLIEGSLMAHFWDLRVYPLNQVKSEIQERRAYPSPLRLR